MPRSLAAVLVVVGACGGGSGRGGGASGSSAPAADAGAAPGDAGEVTVADAGGVDVADAGTEGDGGLLDAGAPSDGGPPDAGITAGWHCFDGGQVQAICTPAPPAQSTACRPPLHPLSPIAPAFDGGIPGPCTETAFNGTAQQDESWTYDSAGNVLTDTQTQGTNLSRLTNIWDPCGRNVYSERRSLDGGLLSATETDFGPDGLLLRTVNTSRWCEQQFGYLLDDAGQVVTVYDPVACTLIERIERDAGVLAAIRPDGQTNWNLLPDGGVLRVRDSNVYGFWSERVWDEQGRPLSESGTGNATSITYIAAWSWDGGQLLRYAGGSQGNGCGSDSWFSEAFVYDGGTLVHEDLAHSGPPCQWGYYNPAWTMDYSSPSDGVQLAQITVDGGVTQLRKTVFDERGNALSVAQAFAPDFTWEPQLRRTYGCFRAK